MGIFNAFSKIIKSNVTAAQEKKSETAGEKPTGKLLAEVFSDCGDFEKRTVRLGGDGEEVSFCFLDGLVSGVSISRDVLLPLTDKSRFDGLTGEQAVSKIIEGSVYNFNTKRRDTLDDVVSDLLNGFCTVIFDKEKIAVSFENRTGDKRSIDLPKEEKVVKGSKDAFIEILRINTMLVRRKLKRRDLKIKEISVGERSAVRIGLFYIEGYTNKEIVAEAEKRIKNIKTDGLLTAADVEEGLVDQPRTPFPQMLSTERPDKFCLNLLEGRVGIIVDGLPIGYLAPGTFAQFLKVPEDAANHFIVGTGITMLRYAAMLVSLILPAFYIAVAMYHQEMIPTKLLQSIIDAKQSVPFPAALEVIIMLIAFELLQEAGLRLPSPVGQTVSIIGGIIVGQSAVEAKVVSPVVVIVVALAGISGYTMPNQDLSSALRICRFLLVIAAILAGMFGLAVGCALLLYHLCTLESFGVPYMTPFVGTDTRRMMRAFLRRPFKSDRRGEPALHTQREGEQR